MSDPAFDSKTATFLEWFRAWPGATFHPDIKIEDLRKTGAGRGIVATADIPQDTILFNIPRTAIISTQTSDLPRRIPQVFETTGLEDADNEADEDGSETSGPPDNWVSLILIMIYEYFQGEKSRWKPYFDVLPTQFETLMWWSEQELQELQASAIVGKIGKDEADEMFRTRVLPVIEEHADVFYPDGSQRLGEQQLVYLSHQMGSTIMSYAFDLENDDEENDPENDDEWVEDKESSLMMGMVPMADILNADAEFNAHVNHGEDSLSVTTLRPIPAGTEILNYYGPLGNGELLRRYGYVTSHHARYDVTEISWNLILSVLKDVITVDESVWGKAVNELDVEEIEDAFVIERDSGEPDSTGHLQEEAPLKEIPADLMDQLHTILKEIRKVSPTTIPDKATRDEIALAAIHRALELRLAQYPTSQAFDFNLLSGDKVFGRQKMALAVRWGEKALLQEAINFTQEKLSKVRSKPDQESEPYAKRQRMR
ncbi:SET domain-containing protein [Annulohypoxylon maeteangense]|uniref:SET domain-containing protein n=1 Tax=Annulohypoxylon maeteangense TaxID=1927788 RepID=UPI002007D1A6|nr:SET domain-containing protein [Annulohypoxylon maeteangense]KAI0883119.1 SET domain-containing protein [Annulohypoxylon maeteangense]